MGGPMVCHSECAGSGVGRGESRLKGKVKGLRGKEKESDKLLNT